MKSDGSVEGSDGGGGVSDRVGGRAVLGREEVLQIKRRKGSIVPGALAIAVDAIKIRRIRVPWPKLCPSCNRPEGQVERSHSGSQRARPGALFSLCS